MRLDVSGLRKAYAGFEFGPVDLTVDDEVLAVLGPSGSGKTTLLSLVAGIAVPDAGSVTLGGRELVGRPPEQRRVGLVFQEGALFPHMTARKNVAYAADDDDRVADLAELLELDDALDRRPAALSGGERQRVALARTLAADPDALLLDEPLSSLDAPIRTRLRDDLHDLFASLDVPVVCVTHDRRTATALGARLAVVRDGGVEQVGEPSAVIDRPATEFVARFTGTENLLAGTVTRRDGDGVRVRVADLSLRATASVEPGTAVTVCVHPSRVELDAPDAADPSDAPDAGESNAVVGTVVRWLNEGSEYRVEVELDDGSLGLTAAVRPPTFDRLAVDAGSELRVVIPPESIHLLADDTPASMDPSA
ncbi:ABC transporter ATP-binding protein [Candidatus Halobonum tyrrellensis]|uniref:Molybdate/tungstate import ATP-binding protein WtpC n=1 Tax=Candidatus Halobonum tyrrellensis G22 TaxID=1324957 RepID=V4HJZ7_9EURY|nr:ABC transporter ATP-binding protein [Candidatus Halobonum tyrrellensis]ESP90103.1 ABC-type transport system ATP-binding protein (probable substrate sulfate/thiosulfate/molybdate) [Candidatus Halobonum tyrrellensis G22]